MSAELFYHQSEVLILIVLFGVLLLMSEAGYQIGKRSRGLTHDLVRAQVGNIQGALLGLFALLLGFTFSMSLSRFDLRKQMVVREANAIGTAALRAEFLPSEQRSENLALFRHYVDVRVKSGNLPNLPTADQKVLNDEASRLQNQLWRHATAAALADPRSVPAGLFVEAMNELIDVKGERDAALANHVPETVLMLLFGFAVLTIGVLGYASGLSATRVLGAGAVLSVLIALVILVILDLDRPGRGMIRVSQNSLISLQESLDQQK